jgi:hypothetical protein
MMGKRMLYGSLMVTINQKQRGNRGVQKRASAQKRTPAVRTAVRTADGQELLKKSSELCKVSMNPERYPGPGVALGLCQDTTFFPP